MKSGAPLRIYRKDTALALAGGVVNIATTDAVATSSEIDLMTYTVPAQLVSNVGDVLRYKMSFFYNAATVTLRLLFGSVHLINRENVPEIIGGTIIVDGFLVVTSAGNFKFQVSLLVYPASVAGEIYTISTASTFSGNPVLKATGKNITQRLMLVDWTPGS